jgi:hypothetical protein
LRPPSRCPVSSSVVTGSSCPVSPRLARSPVRMTTQSWAMKCVRSSPSSVPSTRQKPPVAQCTRRRGARWANTPVTTPAPPAGLGFGAAASAAVEPPASRTAASGLT